VETSGSPGAPGAAFDRDPAFDHAVAQALLRGANRGDRGPAVRIYRPSRPVVAFGRRDTVLPGFPDAVRAVRGFGFTPVLRSPGGRAIAYTRESVVVDHVGVEDSAVPGLDARFSEYAQLWTEVLGELGLDARVGQVPGEFCAGPHSVNARGAVKLVGTAQRILRRAWLFSAAVVVDDAELLRSLLTEVYRALELPFDPASVGSVRDEVPELSAESVEKAVAVAYEQRFPTVPARADADLLAEAGGVVAGHRIDDAVSDVDRH
jgi:lipoate-protein ligase A